MDQINWGSEIKFEDITSMEARAKYFLENGTEREKRLARDLAKALKWINIYILKEKE